MKGIQSGNLPIRSVVNRSDFTKEYERGLLSIIKVAFFKTVKPRQLAFRFVSLDGRGG